MTGPTGPLEGIKVLDFSEHGFVPAGAAALADFGADVIKLERREGDAMRKIIPAGLVPTVDGYDFMFELFNRNKRGIAVDLETAEGREVFEKLVAWADVYITNQLPRVRRKLRTEPDDLFAINPRLVFARGHGQGQRGVDAEAGGYDGVSFWARGAVAHTLTAEGAAAPVQQRPAIGDAPSGMFLAGGICAALVKATRTGQGVVVDTSLLGSAAWTLAPDLAYASIADHQLPLPPLEARSPLTLAYRTSDQRWVSLMMIDEGRYWQQACRTLGIDELVGEGADAASRRAVWPALRNRIHDVVGSMTGDDLEVRLRAEDCIFSFYSTPLDVLDDQAVADNGYLMSHPANDRVRLAAAPVQFDDELPSVRRPAPRLGEHTREILSDLGYDDAAVDCLLTDEVVTA
ncbi:MAG: putative Formyl-CoA transferase [Aeromicrobium sp.]|nr:putative Formyl-CoA transferase [Aeromicrobium sp.]